MIYDARDIVTKFFNDYSTFISDAKLASFYRKQKLQKFTIALA